MATQRRYKMILGVLFFTYIATSTAFAASPPPSESCFEMAKKFFALGVEFSRKTDFYNAVIFFRVAAYNGHSPAMCNLAMCYKQGLGVKQNYKKAVKLYRRAASKGSAGAEFNLGACYYYGCGVAKNYEEAVKLYRRAADKGDSNAEYNLAVCYCHGHGVERDLDKAIEWAERSYLRGGDASAQKLIATLINAKRKSLNPSTL